MSARVYLMKTINGCKDVSIMSPQDEQWRRTSLLCILQFSCFTKYNRMRSKHKQTKCEQTKLLQITTFSVGITILNQSIIKKTISNSLLNSHVYWDTLYDVSTYDKFLDFWSIIPGRQIGVMYELGLTALSSLRIAMSYFGSDSRKPVSTNLNITRYL